MSVIVKSMDMPKNCSDCPLNYDQMACKVTGTRWWSDTMVLMNFDSCKERLYNCPLVEIHTPHSDLVDRNKLLRKAKRESTYAWKMNLHARTETILNQFIDWLDSAEVIIEAEGETE